ncbi:DUF3180 domain-containing protein [Microterricola viridarii]|uniref:DUF3180 domain-containing protein n=1 Tax=Microterricola viridarii TaxID=412690 RepID=A0A120I056_9MICO|nr:DUF3180 domain-containing protein [Microterricola viridarii]AMB57575.1 hypothetical protein AWU67_00415 [Microterricola viridarii]
MKRTAPVTLVLLALGGTAVAFLAELAIAASGRPIIVPPLSLALTLVALGVVVVALAWPIRRAVKAKVRTHVDPFRALRVAVLAKASSLSGALLGGVGLGLLLYLFSRQAVPAAAVLWMAIATAAGGIVLLIAGLIAEHFCTLPPDDTAPDTETAPGSHV